MSTCKISANQSENTKERENNPVWCKTRANVSRGVGIFVSVCFYVSLNTIALLPVCLCVFMSLCVWLCFCLCALCECDCGLVFALLCLCAYDCVFVCVCLCLCVCECVLVCVPVCACDRRWLKRLTMVGREKMPLAYIINFMRASIPQETWSKGIL